MSTASRRILVVEDDPSISLGLRMNLEAEGYSVSVADDGVTGLRMAQEETWDAIIMDVMLPRLNGFEVVKRLRSASDDTPILMLSAKSAEVDKVMGLELGAEDYITKPFGIAELLARIKVALRRRPAQAGEGERPGSSVRFGGVEVDTRTRSVTGPRGPVELTATEFDVLEALIAAEGGVLSRREIFSRVWGPDHHGTPRTIDNFVAQLRAKLEEDPSRPEYLLTVRGVGYRLKID